MIKKGWMDGWMGRLGWWVDLVGWVGGLDKVDKWIGEIG